MMQQNKDKKTIFFFVYCTFIGAIQQLLVTIKIQKDEIIFMAKFKGESCYVFVFGCGLLRISC
jgi:hypothetical protein